MKREFLIGLGIDATLVDQIMVENGKDIEGLKAQLGIQKGLVSDLTGKLNTANSSLEEFKKVDVTALTSERDSYKTKYEQALKDNDSNIANLKKDFALDGVLNSYKFTSDFARTGIKNLINEKNLEFKDGKFTDIDKTMKELQEAHKDAFIPEGIVTKPSFTSSIQTKNDNLTAGEFVNAKYADNPWVKGL
jgi:hypothetical protein